MSGDIARIFAIRTQVQDNHLSMAELGITPAAVLETITSEASIWVAVSGEHLLGFAMVALADACVFAMFVDPTDEGKGAGSALLSQAEKRCLKRINAFG